MSNLITLSDNGKLRLDLESQGDRVSVRPVGVIDEDVNFSVLLDTLKLMGPGTKLLVFDLAQVSRINSCGIREWLLLMEKLNAYSYAFTNVCHGFVEQANVIPNLFGKRAAKVLSFFAPYHCDSCDSESMVLLDPARVRDQEGFSAPPIHCSRCRSGMTPDFVEDEYFNFIKRAV